jgi:hypothetical protein
VSDRLETEPLLGGQGKRVRQVMSSSGERSVAPAFEILDGAYADTRSLG